MPHSISKPRTLLVIEPAVEREFGDLLTWLIDECSRRGEFIVERVTADELTQRRAASLQPDLVVVCQSTPDEFTELEAASWLGSWPVTRFVCCYGPWCDAEGRTRSVWPLSLRTPAANARLRLQQELEVVEGLRQALPVTATREEEFRWGRLDNLTSGVEAVESAGDLEIRIQTPDPEYGAMLSDLCGRPAIDSRSSPRPSPRRIVLWDADPRPLRPAVDAARRVSEVRRMHAADDVVALLGFPRPDDVTELQSAGAAAVLSKLSPAATLWACLRSLSRRTS